MTLEQYQKTHAKIETAYNAAFEAPRHDMKSHAERRLFGLLEYWLHLTCEDLDFAIPPRRSE
jgi:hypothetical protein